MNRSTSRVTICEKCGAARECIDEACPDCAFRPNSLHELAVAALLTTQFDAGEESFGTRSEELDLLARKIRNREHFVMDENELSRHERAVEAFVNTKPLDVYLAIFKFFLPGIAILVGLCLLLMLMRLFVG